MAEYAMVLGQGVGSAAGAAGDWASGKEILIFIGATAAVFFVLYRLFMSR